MFMNVSTTQTRKVRNQVFNAYGKKQKYTDNMIEDKYENVEG